MAYTRTTWVNGSAPAISATNLNNMETYLALLGAQVVNVKDAAFGATGNGTTDDSAAIQAAIDSLSSTVGGTVYFPKGRYKCLTGLSFTGLVGVRLLGESAQGWAEDPNFRGSVLMAGTSSMTLVNVGAAGGVVHQGPVFEHMHFVENVGGSLTTTAKLVKVTGTCNFTFRNCLFRAGSHGIFIDSDDTGRGGSTTLGDAAWWMVDQCLFNGNTYGVYIDKMGGGTIHGGRFECVNTGVHFAGGSMQKVTNAKFDGGQIGIVSNGSATIIGCGLEAQSIAGIKLGGVAVGDDGIDQKVGFCEFYPDDAVGAVGIWMASTLRGPATLFGNTFTQADYVKVKNDSAFGHWRRDGDGDFRLPLAYAPTTTATTLTKFDDLALVDVSGASGAGLTVNLPTITTNASFKGRIITIVKTDSSGNAVTVNTPGSETINGAATYALSAQYQYVTLTFTGTNWIVTGNT